MVIKLAGKCAQGRRTTDGNMLFNALELAVVSKATAGRSHVSVALLREASKKGNVKVRRTSQQQLGGVDAAIRDGSAHPLPAGRRYSAGAVAPNTAVTQADQLVVW